MDIVKISVISILLINNSVLFGMKCDYNKKLTVSKKLRTHTAQSMPSSSDFDRYENNDQLFLPKDVLQEMAACDPMVRNGLQKTCTFWNKELSKKNSAFVSHPSLNVTNQEVDELVLYHNWWHGKSIENLNRHLPNQGFFTIKKAHDGMPGRFAINYPQELNNKHNNNNQISVPVDSLLRLELEESFNMAALCGDVKAVKNIAPKVKIITSVHGSQWTNFLAHSNLLLQMIESDKKEIFEIIAQEDPYVSKNNYYRACSPYGPFLNDLQKSRTITPAKKDTYSALYSKHGGKTLGEIEADSIIVVNQDFDFNDDVIVQKNSSNDRCIIS